jgi:crossover junction endodeoxyribonuclease RuvC
LQSVLDEFRPDEISIEQAIYAQNVRTALALGQARGVILFASMSDGREIFEYSPREVKRAVTGSGNASKQQVQRMIERLLGAGRELGSDEADAAALALCHLMRPRTLGTSAKNANHLTRRAGSGRRSGSRWTAADLERLRKAGRVS